MLNKKTLIQDLNNICTQTDAEWLCASDIYTLNISEDEEKFLATFRKAGFSKKDILIRNIAALEYGGGLRFNYKDVLGSGYTFPVSQKYKAFMVFAGFQTNFEQSTIYHECAHLYQRKFNFFTKKEAPDDAHRKYLKEVHANTFSSMVMLLRAEDVLAFKKQQHYCLAADIEGFNRNSEKNKFYYSLPVVLELVKDIRRQGRDKALQNFSKDNNLDFEKIAFYTAALVKKYAYTPLEFYQIRKNLSVSSYDMLKQKAKSWRLIGKRYVLMQQEKLAQEAENYRLTEKQRREKTDLKIQKLPEVDEKAKIINAVCEIDILNTRLNQDFGIYANLDDLIDKNTYCMHDISDKEARQEALKICDQIVDIHKKWHKDLYFKKLYNKINHPDTRDSVWALKFKKQQEILLALQKSNFNGK